MAGNKRINEKPNDRLSALPDCLLIYILAFLEMKEAAVTSVLSKRWQFIWTESPRLVFREYSWSIKKTCRFVDRVNRTLVICHRNNLERFEIYFKYGERFAWDVNIWVEFAVKNKVKEICLRMFGDWDKHRLRQMMYTNSSLTSLFLQGCIMAPREAVDWPSLTELKLEEMELHQHVIEKILSGCPVLRSFVLKNCWGYNCFEVNSRSLYKLIIFDHQDDNEPLLKISAPYVRHLGIALNPKERKLHLTNVPSVVSADIDFNGCVWGCSSEEVMSNAKELLEKTKHVKALKLGHNFANVVSMLVVKGWLLPQSSRRLLTIRVVFTGKHDISGIMGLLESSPYAESLVIDISHVFFGSEEPAIVGPSATDDDLDCDFLHLKNVEIKHTGEPNLGIDQMLALARILLKRATVLEEMVIVTNLKDTVEFVKIRQTLITYPRSSQKAVLVPR